MGFLIRQRYKGGMTKELDYKIIIKSFYKLFLQIGLQNLLPIIQFLTCVVLVLFFAHTKKKYQKNCGTKANRKIDLSHKAPLHKPSILQFAPFVHDHARKSIGREPEVLSENKNQQPYLLMRIPYEIIVKYKKKMILKNRI